MSATIPRDCKERIDELMNAARTMPDDKLISGMCNPGFQKHHGTLEIPTVGVGQVFHEDATSGFSNYSPVRYDGTLTKAYYPSGQHANVQTTSTMTTLQTVAGTLTRDGQPTAGWLWLIHHLYLTSTATAAGREATVNLTDGVNTVPIWASGAAAIASSAEYQIWPVDISTLYTGGAILIGADPMPITNSTYIQLVSVGLVAAEAHTLNVHRLAYEVGGLE